MKSKLKIATYNANLKLCHTIYLQQILQFCTNNNIHLLLLQETGTKIPVLPPNSSYKYIFHPPPIKKHPPHHMTGIFIHKSLFSTISNTTYHEGGRFTSVQISLPSQKTLRVNSNWNSDSTPSALRYPTRFVYY